ncbi:YqaJ viral recombinase family protein [Sinorhizobium fredii]|uniref:YqaJ viral recombinase family protein n=1 Tax=Rhizobium fredii TaxID=380 RepID=UPI0005B361B4|nr:YqaJ viral recombinase family protein [Sinorhizobium fredii]
MIERRAITSIQLWLEWRRSFLCASEVAAAAGIDEYRSALALYAEKLGLTSVVETPIMRRGRHFEAAAASYLMEERDDWRVQRQHVFIMDTERRLACTPDCLAEVPGYNGICNVQIKTVSQPKFDEWHGVPPVGYTLQVACENMLIDAAHGFLAVLSVSTYEASLHLFDVPRHAGAEEKLAGLADGFWKNIEAARLPKPDYRLDADTIAAMHPHAVKGETIDLSGDNRLAEILPYRLQLKDRLKADGEELQALDAEIREKVGDAEEAQFPGWKITCRDQSRMAYTVPEWRGRVLRVSERGKE